MIVVFGAGGFIGTYLVDKLREEGFNVLASDIDPIVEEYYKSKQIAFVQADITKKDWINSVRIDNLFYSLADNVQAVVNVACLQPVNVSTDNYSEEDYIKVNVLGTLNILSFCKKVNAKKYLHTVSHRGVQGAWHRGEVITEESKKELKYTGNYAMFSISECAALDCIEYYSQTHGVKSIIFRLPPIYGYGPHLEGYCDGKPLKSGFMSFIEKAIAGEEIDVWGDINRSRDIIYVKDVVSAIVLAIRNKEATGLYNISSKSVSLLDEVLEISKVFSSKDKIPYCRFVSDKPNSIEQFSYDITKAKKELQWEPKYTLVGMLEDIKREMSSGRFSFLIEKRKKIFAKMG